MKIGDVLDRNRLRIEEFTITLSIRLQNIYSRFTK